VRSLATLVSAVEAGATDTSAGGGGRRGLADAGCGRCITRSWRGGHNGSGGSRAEVEGGITESRQRGCTQRSPGGGGGAAAVVAHRAKGVLRRFPGETKCISYVRQDQVTHIRWTNKCNIINNI
jgi:hypothetical protein